MGCDKSSNNSTLSPESCSPTGLCIRYASGADNTYVCYTEFSGGVFYQSEAECLVGRPDEYPDHVYTWTELHCDCESFCDTIDENTLVDGYDNVYQTCQ